jgi:hypothetical protein
MHGILQDRRRAKKAQYSEKDMRVDGMKSISLYESIKSNDLRLQEI